MGAACTVMVRGSEGWLLVAQRYFSLSIVVVS